MAIQNDYVYGGVVTEKLYDVWFYSGAVTTPSVKTYPNERVSWTLTNDVFPPETPWIKGVFKITPLTRSKKVVTTLPGFTHITWPRRSYPYQDGHLEISGPYAKFVRESDSFNWTTPVDTSARARVLQKAAAKIQQNNLDLAVELGELRETLEFLKSPYRSTGEMLEKILKAYVGGKSKRKEGPTLGDVRRYLGSTWLETRFALLPLIRSFAAILEEFDRKSAKAFDPTRIHVSRASEKASFESTRKVANQRTYNWFYFDKFGTLVTEQKTKACVFYRLTKPTDKLATLGLAKDDMPESLWELVPLSFVVDRFLLVGDWLRSHTLPPNVEILGNTVSTRTKWTGEISYYPSSNRTILSHNSSRTYYQRDDYVRVINQPFPYLPQISSLRTLTNWTHYVDHLALTQSLISSKKR